MGNVFSQLGKLLIWGVGISDPGTIPRKIDLWKIATEEGWKVTNLSASNLNHKGKEAVRLTASGDDGMALMQELHLPECKLDLSLAAVNQQVGLVVRATDENRYDLVSLEVDAGSALNLKIRFGSNASTVELPAHLLGEWIGVRVAVAPQFTAVFVNGNNMPSLKVPTGSQTSKGDLIGLQVGKDSQALVADLKYVQSRKRDFE